MHEIIIYNKFNSDLSKIWKDFELCSKFTIFQCYEWQKAYFETFIEKNKNTILQIVVVKREEKILILMPFVINIRFGLNILVWHGENYCDYLSPIISKDYKLDRNEFLIIFNKIIKKLGFIDIINFKNQPMFIDKFLNPFVIFLRNKIYQDSFYIKLEDNWDNFYNYNSVNKTRNTDRRKEKKLKILGNLNFQINNNEDFINILNFILHNKSRISKKKEVFLFYKFLFDNNKKKFQMLNSTLRIDKRIIAATIGFVYDKIYYYILTAYHKDKEISINSPGRILFLKLLNWCSDNNIKTVDLTDGEIDYKLHFSSIKIPLYQHFSSITLKGFLFVLFYKIVRIFKFTV